MLSLLTKWLHQAPQIWNGTVDFVPGPTLGGEDWPRLANENNQSPSGVGVGIGLAEPYEGEGEWDIAEYLAYYPYNGVPQVSLAGDLRPPPDFVVKMRQSAEYGTLQDFKDKLAEFREELELDIAYVESLGRRFSDLQTSGFGNDTDNRQTFDIYDAEGDPEDPPVGCAFIGRSASDRTRQHWVLFTSQAFDNVRVKLRATPHASTSAFLSDMADKRAESPVAFNHAYEEVKHFFDLPTE